MSREDRRPLLALLALAALVAAVHHHNTPPAQAARFCAALRTPSGRGAVAPVTTGSPIVVVLGDSYSSGYALTQPRPAWPKQLGQIEHWEVYVDAVAGTGFVNGGFCSQPYTGRVQQVLAHRPQRVIVQVGINDSSVAAPTEQ